MVPLPHLLDVVNHSPRQFGQTDHLKPLLQVVRSGPRKVAQSLLLFLLYQGPPCRVVLQTFAAMRGRGKNEHETLVTAEIVFEPRTWGWKQQQLQQTQQQTQQQKQQ